MKKAFYSFGTRKLVYNPLYNVCFYKVVFTSGTFTPNDDGTVTVPDCDEAKIDDAAVTVLKYSYIFILAHFVKKSTANI